MVCQGGITLLELYLFMFNGFAAAGAEFAQRKSVLCFRGIFFGGVIARITRRALQTNKYPRTLFCHAFFSLCYILYCIYLKMQVEKA